MTEAQLQEAVGLHACYQRLKKTANAYTLFTLERHLLLLGVKLDNPVGPPPTDGPDGGRVLKIAA
jgi:hypothetical protein